MSAADAPGRDQGHVAQHGRALLGILVVSGIGVAATAGFQFAVIRGLGPAGYGLLASFLALINVASVGSTALRNSVAVTLANERLAAPSVPRRRRLDGSAWEALLLGGLCTLGLLVASPLVSTGGDVSLVALGFLVATVTPYFLAARAQGLLQGAGRARAVVVWTTGGQVLQLALSLGALALGLGAVGVLVVILVVATAQAVGIGVQAGRLGLGTISRAFGRGTIVVLLLTIAFTWVTSMDVVLVRSQVASHDAGAYAAAVIVIKTMLIVPSTLSLYLLPRFVNRKDDRAMTRLGVVVSLGITLGASVVLLGVVVLARDLLARVFGAGYDLTAELLPVLAVSWIPWALAQALLIRLTAAESSTAIAVVVGLALLQWFGGTLVLPSLEGFVWFNGAVGAATFVAFLVVHLLLARRGAPAPAD